MSKFIDDAFRQKYDPENLLAFPPMYTYVVRRQYRVDTWSYLHKLRLNFVGCSL